MRDIIRTLDKNLEAITHLSLGYVLQSGLKYGVFQKLSKGVTKEKLLASIPVPNKRYLEKLLTVYLSLGVLSESDGTLEMNDFSYEYRVGKEDIGVLLPEWVQILEELHKMSDYAFISAEHPKILMDFDKGADFWDMRLLTEPSPTSRRLIIELLNLEDGMHIIDLGCGSVSPIELGEAVGPNGKYVGVDFSPGLLSIARARLKNARIDWVVLREMDLRKIVPKTEYDAVILSFVLEYFNTPSPIIRKALEMLRPGGKLIVVEPFRDNYPLIPALEFFESLTPEFVRFPSASSVVAAVEEAPYDVKIEAFGKSTLLITRLL